MDKDTKNPFTKKRQQEDAPLHVAESFGEKPSAKSFSLYQTDVERIDGLKEKLKTKSRKKLNDSLIVRVALAYLEESVEKAGERFDKDLRRLIGENR